MRKEKMFMKELEKVNLLISKMKSKLIEFCSSQDKKIQKKKRDLLKYRLLIETTVKSKIEMICAHLVLKTELFCEEEMRLARMKNSDKRNEADIPGKIKRPEFFLDFPNKYTYRYINNII